MNNKTIKNIIILHITIVFCFLTICAHQSWMVKSTVFNLRMNIEYVQNKDYID